MGDVGRVTIVGVGEIVGVEEGVGGKTLTTKEEFSDEKKYSANVSVLKGKRGVSEIFDIPNNNTNSTGLILSTFIPPYNNLLQTFCKVQFLLYTN